MALSHCAKTSTERPIIMSAPMVRAILAGTKTQTRRVIQHPQIVAPCPYGKPRDRLWVRENWRPTAVCLDRWTSVLYAADEAHEERPYFRTNLAIRNMRPSIHMPRAACRLFLGITAVRMERLLDITVEDSFDEGIVQMRCPECHLMAYGLPEWGHDDLQKTPIEAYWHLWDKINEERGYGRSKDPWVWAITFRRVH